VYTNQTQDIVHHNEQGRLTIRSRGGNGREIFRYGTERRFFSILEHTWEGELPPQLHHSHLCHSTLHDFSCFKELAAWEAYTPS